MRLIDADALDKRIYNDVPISTFGSMRRMAAVRELIEEAPTVEPASPWRRVEDELPKSGEMVIIYDGAFGFGRHEKGAWEWVDTFESGPAEVTHWMPLPEPPKGDA